MDYIKKDKQIEYIMLMLCNKLKSHNDQNNQQNEWRNSSFCLTQIKFNEKLLQKLLDQYECWKERIIDHEPTKNNFLSIVENIRKQGSQTDVLKALVNDLEKKINLGNEAPDGQAVDEDKENSSLQANRQKSQVKEQRRSGRLNAAAIEEE